MSNKEELDKEIRDMKILKAEMLSVKRDELDKRLTLLSRLLEDDRLKVEFVVGKDDGAYKLTVNGCNDMNNLKTLEFSSLINRYKKNCQELSVEDYIKLFHEVGITKTYAFSFEIPYILTVDLEYLFEWIDSNCSKYLLKFEEISTREYVTADECKKAIEWIMLANEQGN